MWNNAPMLRGIANALITFSVSAMLYGLAYYVVHLPGLFPLQSVRLSAAPQRVDAAGIVQVMRSEAKGNFFTVDIERLRQSLERLPWVRNVSIRRDFPGSLEVRLEEYQALARWNGSALVDSQGEVFVAGSGNDKSGAVQGPDANKVSGQTPRDGTNMMQVPDFVGQEGTAVEVTQRYMQFSRQLASLDLQVTRLVLSPRHAWQLSLNNGMVLELGHEDMQKRLERFVEAYPDTLAAMQSRVKYVDLRYSNGFAVTG